MLKNDAARKPLKNSFHPFATISTPPNTNTKNKCYVLFCFAEKNANFLFHSVEKKSAVKKDRY